MKDLRSDLSRLNSATKYPSIPTYHALGEKGRLTSDLNVIFEPSEDVVVTEKVDGTNARIVLYGCRDWFVGSREHLLFAKGDRIRNPAQQIAEALAPLLDMPFGEAGRDGTGFDPTPAEFDGALVFYGEVYGGKVTAASKQYGAETLGFRLFDVARLSARLLESLSDESPEAISSWREDRGPEWADERELRRFVDAAAGTGAERFFTLTPRIAADSPPTDHAGVHDWLSRTLPASLAKLDAAAPGSPEGVVVRTSDRRKIAKIRFQDYRRTLGVKSR